MENKFANIPPKLKNINPKLARCNGAYNSLVNHNADQSIIIPFDPKITKSKKPKIKTFFSGNFNFSPSPLKSNSFGKPLR